MNTKAIVVISVLIILVSLQYTLNKILLEIKEIKEILRNRLR
ncbi:hypothetical protein [Clostridium sp. Cult2]|nr:hypothetical protein [Clostridium sp. Cult2]